jgi:hypothetical protein
VAYEHACGSTRAAGGISRPENFSGYQNRVGQKMSKREQNIDSILERLIMNPGLCAFLHGVLKGGVVRQI